ncbi:MAG TPA: biosynthetic-type acetolactate synthase large subunit [Anaerolineae bacterium]|nr:biosynthetic-type acetolactate synthase large subunit [Anaerolineae bacterium]
MKLKGAQVVCESLMREGVEVIFGYPGGAVIPIYDALVDYPLRHVLVRHEQAAAHAADGYARATGRVGVCFATSGPGATNLVTGIATAYLDSSPLLAVTGQVPTAHIGKDAFQEVDVTGITLPITKHNYLVTRAEDLPRVMKEAFHIARTGRPGPVLVDIAKDAQTGEIEFDYPEEVDLPGYKPTVRGHEGQIKQAAQLISESRRPVIFSGHGVTLANAQQELRRLAETIHAPVITTLLGIGSFPRTHALCLGMSGMHGEAYANKAVQGADVLIAVGMRFSDRVTGKVETFARDAKVIHIDVDPAEIGKNVPVDVPVVGDVKHVLESLNARIEPAEHNEWLATVHAWRQESEQRDILNRETDDLLPPYIIRQIWHANQGDAIMVSDVGQNQMWEAQYYLHDRYRSLITSGGLGTMGFALPAAVGVQVGCPDDEVWVTVGDGGIQMNIQELATVVQEGLPLKIAILNNSYLGMVRQWQELFFGRRYSGTPISSPDYVKLAEAYGLAGFRVTEKDAVVPTLRRAREVEGPVLIEFRVAEEENVYPMVPAGGCISSMLRRPMGSEEAI